MISIEQIWILSAVGVIFGGIWLSTIIPRIKCPKCSKILKTRRLTKDLIYKEEQFPQTIKKYRMVYKCNNCNHIWTAISKSVDDPTS
jgi:uncharacterized Zn finger protein